jgi:KaiC/GvpD/RAD55 family RecA-like ATPase
MNEKYVPTGISGVDEILAGKGIPKGHSILVSGGPGSGKTTFAIQYLYVGATEYNESGIYVTLDEEPNDIKKNMQKYGWDLTKLEEEKKLKFINVSPVRIAPSETGLIQIGMKEFRLIKLLEAIKQGVKEVNAKRVVVDPITIFTLQYPNDIERIYAMRDLLRDLRQIDTTNIMISELKGTGWEREHQFEEYLTQGVIILRTFLSDGRITRVFQAEKMRGLPIDNQPRPYDISANGIEVYHDAVVYK